MLFVETKICLTFLRDELKTFYFTGPNKKNRAMRFLFVSDLFFKILNIGVFKLLGKKAY